MYLPTEAVEALRATVDLAHRHTALRHLLPIHHDAWHWALDGDGPALDTSRASMTILSAYPPSVQSARFLPAALQIGHTHNLRRRIRSHRKAVRDRGHKSSLADSKLAAAFRLLFLGWSDEDITSTVHFPEPGTVRAGRRSSVFSETDSSSVTTSGST